MTSIGVLLLVSLGGLAGVPSPVPSEVVLAQAEQAAPASDAPAAEASASSEPLPGALPVPRFGVLFDVGVPDGLGLSGVYRPMHWLRLHGGLTHNLGALGLRGGVSFAPFYFPLTPTLSVDVGRTFSADYRSIARKAGLDDPKFDPLLRDLTYTYANAHLGLEVGAARRFVFFLRGGVSYFALSVPGFQEFLQASAGDPSITAKNPRLRFTLPTLKLGVTFYFR